jgi:hypothetical protein
MDSGDQQHEVTRHHAVEGGSKTQAASGREPGVTPNTNNNSTGGPLILVTRAVSHNSRRSGTKLFAKPFLQNPFCQTKRVWQKGLGKKGSAKGEFLPNPFCHNASGAFRASNASATNVTPQYRGHAGPLPEAVSVFDVSNDQYQQSRATSGTKT